MKKSGNAIAARAALVAFALVFLVCTLRNFGVDTGATRGLAVAAAVFVAVKILHGLFIASLLDGLTEHVSGLRLEHRKDTES